MNCPPNVPLNDFYSFTNEKVHKEISGLRFQPIVKLESRTIIGWEILTWLRNEDPEIWFSSLSNETYMAIFLWQAQEALRCDGFFWINLPVRVLSDPFCISQICEVSHNRKLIIEVQDPENVLTLDFISCKFFSMGLQTLRRYGWIVWLDDVKSDFVEKLDLISFPVDGIKIDKSELKKPLQIRNTILKAMKLSANILVEGIESHKDYLCASELGVQLGQGFMWKEKKVRMSIPVCYFSDIWQGRKNKDDISYNIYINCGNEFLKTGIYYVLWELIRNRINHIERNSFRVVEQEKNANVIILEKKTGEVPIDCTHFIGVSARSHRTQPIRILISHERNVKEVSSCPGITYTLSYKDDLSRYIKVINEAITLARFQSAKPEVDNKISSCSQCLRNKVTKRERDVIDLMADGKSVDSIAQKYGCTQKVVGAHKRAFMRKLGIRNKVEFYSYLYRISENLKHF